MKRACIVDQPSPWRRAFELLGVSSSNCDLVRFERCSQACHDVLDFAAPLFQTMFFQTADSDVVLESGFLVRQVSQFHGLDDSIDDERGSEPCTKAEEE